MLDNLVDAKVEIVLPNYNSEKYLAGMFIFSPVLIEVNIDSTPISLWLNPSNSYSIQFFFDIGA